MTLLALHMQAAMSSRLGLYLQTPASQPLHEGPFAIASLFETLWAASGQFGAAPGLAAVCSGLLQTALAQLGGAAGASLAALPVVDLGSGAEAETIDRQLLHLLGQVCSMPFGFRECHQSTSFT